MNSLNSVILEGNVVRSPDMRETAKGTPICKFSVAINRWTQYREGMPQKEVSFFDIDAWGDLAKACAQSCEKGRGVRIVGRLKQNRWQDPDGKNKTRIVIVAEHVEFKPKFSLDATAADDARQKSVFQTRTDADSAAFADFSEAAAQAREEQIAAVF
ncbi:single-stranded DNA-binding protein [Treponema endosymbiont of Eucomonympha sp.]|uniref:single-stranded DNA-binding protein n=2 Tax=Treponema endosymbiont of Eucomonympha sp. TaxID=1580831 RepID=UPI000A3290B6|nr:single-stranded DNA-binding protein [Treponema endosymbiont of Eucomonympha sp.]